MKSCSIITISNNVNMLEEFKSNLKTQENVSYQLIVVDNTKNSYSGARAAFNSVLDKIENDIVIFLHPDIRFLNKVSLSDILLYIDKIKNFGVIGVAGCPSGREWKIYTTIIHGSKKVNPGISISKEVEVQTVDECFFIISCKFF